MSGKTSAISRLGLLHSRCIPVSIFQPQYKMSPKTEDTDPEKQVPNLRLRRLIIRGMDSSRFVGRIMPVSPARPVSPTKQPNQQVKPAQSTSQSPAQQIRQPTNQPIPPASVTGLAACSVPRSRPWSSPTTAGSACTSRSSPSAPTRSPCA